MNVPTSDFPVRFSAQRFMGELQAALPGRVAQVWDDSDNAQVVIQPDGAPFTAAEQTAINTAVVAHAGPFTQAERDDIKRTALRNFLGV